MPLRNTILSLALLLAASVPLALAQGTYTQIDCPGAFSTAAMGIDAAGDVIGYCLNSTISGFLLRNGRYTIIKYPEPSHTYLIGINDAGTEIVGYSDYPKLLGFVYHVFARTFTPVVYPGTDYALPLAVNNAGTVVGNTLHDGDYIGFELTASGNGTLIAADPDPRIYTVVRGISSLGVAVGYTETGISFAFDEGKYLGITGPNVGHPRVLGINPPGTALVGEYDLPFGTSLGFVYQLGFMHQDKAFTPLQFPGSIITAATGINRAGEVVGSFGDATGAGHGFLWTPPADTAKK